MLRTYQCESVPHGTLFIDTSNQGYIHGDAYYISDQLSDAVDEFVDELATSTNTKITANPTDLVQALVDSHGLIIICKLQNNVRPEIVSPLPPGDYLYQVEDFDGLLTIELMRNAIDRGTIGPDTMVKVETEEGRIVRDYCPAYKLNTLQTLFTLATPHETSLKSHLYAAVTSRFNKLVDFKSVIADYFDITDSDRVLVSKTIEQAVNGKGMLWSMGSNWDPDYKRPRWKKA